jgi:coenzyme PQQ precursor peptide PqqA
MVWEAPAFEEIDMSAEIGSYQADFDPEPRPIAEPDDE